MGAGRTRTIARHLLPNTLGTLVVNATFQVADAIILLATLSFLGLRPAAPGRDLGRDALPGHQRTCSTVTGGRCTRPAC